MAERAAAAKTEELTAQLDSGVMLLKDILAQLARPGRDPREDLPPPIFKKGVIKLDDLSPGMELSGTVLNVVDFGAFVDIGLHDTGLVHISQLANKFVRDPHEVVSVGDIVKVWVHEIDKARRRVSLTMIAPGTQRTHSERRSRSKPEGKPRPGAAATEAGEPAAAAAAAQVSEAPPPSRTPRRPAGQPAAGARRIVAAAKGADRTVDRRKDPRPSRNFRVRRGSPKSSCR